MKFSIKDFFSKCDQTGRKLRVWSDLLKKSLMENFIFCTVEEEEVAGLLESLLVCRQLGQGHDSQGAPMGAEWATSHGYYHAGCFGYIPEREGSISSHCLYGQPLLTCFQPCAPSMLHWFREVKCHQVDTSDISILLKQDGRSYCKSMVQRLPRQNSTAEVTARLLGGQNASLSVLLKS